MTTLSATRKRARIDRYLQAVQDLPREAKAAIMRDIDRYAPELRDLMRECQAVPFRLRVRDGDGWRDVVSPDVVRKHQREAQ